MRLNKNIKIFINYFFGPLLFIWLSYSIWHQVKNQPDLEQSWSQIRHSFNSPLIWNLFFVLILMIVNWSIEALKWKISIKQIQPVSFFVAFKAILSGVSFSVTTPNRIGEYLGRVLYMEEGNRIKAVSLTIVSSMSQLIITLLMGFAGLIILREALESHNLISSIWIKVTICGVWAALLVVLLLYFRLSWLVKWVDRLKPGTKYSQWINALEFCTTPLLFKLLLLSALRFLVFALQYLLLFRLFGVEINWYDAFWAVNVSFLVLAAIPTFAIAEIAQRGYIAQTFVGLYSSNITGIIFSTVSIWFINLIIPAVLGSLLILGLRRIIKRDNVQI